MPRDGSNIYHRPAGTDGVPNYPIESSKYNAYVADVEQDLNLPRPIVAGGTGATSADGALVNLSAEKAAQIVTNWDATTWMAGSYFAATTATGAAPVAGHAFAGIAYVSNATMPITDMVLEATDLTDVSDPTSIPQYIRVMTAGVWGTWAKKLATTPIPGMLGEYTFDSGITFPPGSGQVRFNNATQNSTTEVFISHLSALGLDNTGIIPFSLKSGYDFYIQDKDEPAKWKMFTATADPVLSGGDFRVTATFKSGGTNVVSGQRMLVGANTGTSATAYAVRYDAAQSLNTAQKAQGRANIDAVSNADIRASKKNYIINGAMMVSQENGTTVGPVGSYWPVDAFTFIGVTSGTANGVQVGPSNGGAITPAGSINRLRIAVATVDTSIAAGEWMAIRQGIEGLRTADLQFGSAAAKTITIQFGVRAPAGTYCLAVENATVDRCYVAEYVIAAGEANIDVVKSVTITGDITGTWAKDNTVGLYLYWVLISGTNFQTTAGSWQAVNKFATVNQFNFMGQNTFPFELFDVSLTEGTVAPPFQVPDYADELAACRRYWWCSNIATPKGTNVGTIAGYSLLANVITLCNIQISPPMRATPTFTIWSIGVQNNVRNTSTGAAISVGAPSGNISPSGGISFSVVSLAATNWVDFDMQCNARL